MSEHEHDHETCKQFFSSLGDYVDGALSESLCAELEKHIKDCDRCRIVVDTMKKTVELYHNLAEDQDIPQDTRERLFMKLNLEEFLK